MKRYGLRALNWLQVLERVPRGSKTFYSNDSPAEVGGLEILDETVYHNITPSGMPPHELRLKEGCVVILLRNLNVTEGMCNGTRLRVDKMSERVSAIYACIPRFSFSSALS